MPRNCWASAAIPGSWGRIWPRVAHQVTVLTAAPYYPQWRVQEDYRPQRWRREWLDGVEVLRAPQYVPARVSGLGRLLQECSFDASCLYWWSTCLLARPWDAMVAVCPPMTSGLVPGLLARRLGIPLVIHVQDLQLDAARELGILRQPLLLEVLTRLELRLFRQARKVTTISRSMAARLAAKGVAPSRLQVLPNWADLDNGAARPAAQRPSPGAGFDLGDRGALCRQPGRETGIGGDSGGRGPHPEQAVDSLPHSRGGRRPGPHKVAGPRPGA